MHEMSQCHLPCGDRGPQSSCAREQVYPSSTARPAVPTELRVANDANAYVQTFLERGKVPEGIQSDHVFKHTTSTCPQCLALVQAEVVIRAGKVFFKKTCAKCGPSEALVSEDAKLLRAAPTPSRARAPSRSSSPPR